MKLTSISLSLLASFSMLACSSITDSNGIALGAQLPDNTTVALNAVSNENMKGSFIDNFRQKLLIKEKYQA